MVAAFVSINDSITSFPLASLTAMDMMDGGEATRVLEQGAYGNWSLIDQGICFFNLEPGGPALRFFSFAEHKASLLRKFSKETRIDTFDTALSATADGRRIIYTQLDQVASDLMLVENFR